MLSRFEFLIELARRRIIERYIGSSLMMMWVVIAPLIPLATNLVVFYFIAKIPAIQSMGIASYAVYIFSGLLPFRIMQSVVAEASDLFVNNMELLKSVNFPLNYLSMAAVAALMMDFGVQFVLMLALLFVSKSGIGLNILLFPFSVLLLIFFLLGISWTVSVAGYLFREMREIMAMAFSALLYLSPVMYPLGAAPPLIRKLLLLNPISHFVIIFRDSLLSSDNSPHWGSWIVASILSTFTFGIGYFAICRIKRFVGDMV